MARKPRVHAPGSLYHVMLRGNAGADLFLSDRDRVLLEGLVAEGVGRFAHRVHAYCWMTNHIHLAIEVGAVPLARIVHNLAFRYASWMNRRQRRAGHVFQGRYKALLVDRDRYLLTLVRYIHRNPVKARLVARAADYRWSSHRAYLGLETKPWLSTGPVLGYFGERVTGGRRRFSAFIDQAGPADAEAASFEGAGAGALLPIEEPPPVREEGARARAVPAVTIADICALIGGALGVEPSALTGPSRARRIARARHLIGFLTVDLGCGTLSDLARCFGRDRAALHRGVVQIGRRLESDVSLRRQVARWTELLSISHESHA